MTTRNFRPVQFPEDAIHIALDLETAGKVPGVPIVQLAAVVAGANGMFNRYISLMSCEQAGLVPEKETMEWWNEQDPKLRSVVFSGTNNITETLQEFKQWCSDLAAGDLNRIVLWGNGVEFDNAILKHAWELFETWPFHYRNNHHLRTILAVTPQDLLENAHHEYMSRCGTEDAVHDGLHDAIYQADMLEVALQYHGWE